MEYKNHLIKPADNFNKDFLIYKLINGNQRFVKGVSSIEKAKIFIDEKTNNLRGVNMKTYNEIKEVENKINDLNSFINNQNQHLVNFTNEKCKSEVLDKVSSAIESVVSNEKKLKQLKLKLKKEKLLTLKIKSLEALGVKVVSRERDYNKWTYNIENGFCPEKIEVMLGDKVVPLTFMHNGFYISYRDHGGQALFNLFEDKVEDKHLFYTKEIQ